MLALLAAGFALVFSGCSDTKDETETEQDGGTGSGDETGGTGGSNDGTEKPGDSGSSGGGQTNNGGDENGAKGKVIKGIGVGGDEGFTFADLTIKDAYCGTYDGKNDVVAAGGELIISISEDGVLTMAGYEWDKTYLTFSQAVDLSSFSKMTIEAKVSDGYKPGDAVVFEFSSSDKAASGVSTWTDETFFGDLTTSFKSFSIGMDKFQCLKNNSVYCKDDHSKDGDNAADKCTFTNAADMKAIKEIAINPRGASGNIYIKSIKFE